MKSALRVFILAAVVSAAVLSCSGPPAREGGASRSAESRPYLEAAADAGAWIRGLRADTPHGPAWSDDEVAPGEVTPWLGTGAAGPTLFFLRLAAATGDSTWFDDARRGAAFLAASVPADGASVDGEAPRAGLYDGWAGVGFVLAEAAHALRDPEARVAAERCARLVLESVRRGDAGGEDGILTGRAGSGLFLLYAADRLGLGEAKAGAEEIGRSLIGRAARDSLGRLHWREGNAGPAVSPGFGRGTAGIAYFLATLHVATGDPSYLDAALGAGTYLNSIARADSASFLLPIAHPGPGSAVSEYEISWEQGVAGTGRLLHRLARVTGDPEWSAILGSCIGGIRASGLPAAAGNRFRAGAPFPLDVRSGQAGAASFVLHIGDETGEDADLEYGKLLVDDLLSRGTLDGRGLRWTAPESWTWETGGALARTERTCVPTGYLHGVAGIGMVLLQMDAVSQGMSWEFALPDDPFAADLAF